MSHNVSYLSELTLSFSVSGRALPAQAVTARPRLPHGARRHLRAIRDFLLSGSEPISTASAVVICSAGGDGRHDPRTRHSELKAIRPDRVPGRTTPRADSLCLCEQARDGRTARG